MITRQRYLELIGQAYEALRCWDEVERDGPAELAAWWARHRERWEALDREIVAAEAEDPGRTGQWFAEFKATRAAQDQSASA